MVDIACGPFQTFFITEHPKTGHQIIWHAGAGYNSEFRKANTESASSSPVNRPEPSVTSAPLTRSTPLPIRVTTSFLPKGRKISKIVPSGIFCLWLDGELSFTLIKLLILFPLP